MSGHNAPLVFGGIGDSGTRAVAYLVTQMGVWMGKFGVTVKKDSRDSKLFINGFETLTCDEEDLHVQSVIKSYVFYSRSIEHCKSIAYGPDCVTDKLVWNQGVQWTASLLRTLLNHTLVYTARRSNHKQYPFGLWGFKHPRSSFVLPYISYVTGNHMSYVHIVRDGRDIAAGDNQYFFNSICKRYHTVDNPLCEDRFENRVELWSRLNMDVLHFARRNFRPGQFLIVRIEDLVTGHRACFERIAAFINTGASRGEEVINNSIKLFTIKQNRYFGLKYGPKDRRAYTEAVRSNPISTSAFRALGYRVEEWGTERNDCQDLVFPFPGWVDPLARE